MSRTCVRAERKIVSHYDATFAVADPYPEQDAARGPDPLLDGVTRAYGGAFVGYARDELGFKTEMTYILLASDVAGKWDWDEGSAARPASAADDLRELLALDALVPADDRARLQRHGHALCGERYVLDHLPPIGDADARAAYALSRRPHVLYRSAIAQGFQRRRKGVLSIVAMTARRRGAGMALDVSNSFLFARPTCSTR